MEWTGKNAAKNHLRLVIASIFIADLRLRDTHKSRFWNRSSFPVFSNNIMLSFYLAIPLYLPKCYELLVEVRLGSVRVGSVGSRIRFSHSYCLFWLLCLKSILPKCGWINFMLFDFLPNFKRQQTQKIKKTQIKNSNKSIGKKMWLSMNEAVVDFESESSESEWSRFIRFGSSVPTEVESSWSRHSQIKVY